MLFKVSLLWAWRRPSTEQFENLASQVWGEGCRAVSWALSFRAHMDFQIFTETLKLLLM